MRTIIFSSFLLILFLHSRLNADEVSGHIVEFTIWSGNIEVVGDVTIDNGITLVIEPSTYVEFQGHYKLDVQGTLHAVGTEQDTIYFMASNVEEGWRGIRFDETEATNDSSKIVYCKIQHGMAVGEFPDGRGGAIFINGSSKLLVSNCNIINNRSTKGGGIYINESSNIIFRNNTIEGNTAISSGGGIFCYESTLDIENNIVRNNRAEDAFASGGGIFFYHTTTILANNIVETNHSYFGGGGIYCFESDIILIENTINNNSTDNGGGGIYCEGSEPVLVRNTICNNTSLGQGGGIDFTTAYPSATFTPLLKNNIIANNQGYHGGGINCYNTNPILENNVIAYNIAEYEGGGIFAYTYSHLEIVNTIIWGNYASRGDQGVIINDSDASFDYCDIEGGIAGIADNSNGTYGSIIDLDPMFVDSEQDYHLRENSLCIDMGNPGSAYNDLEDPENPGYALYPSLGTILNDLGAYGGSGVFFTSVQNEHDIINIPINSHLNQNYPNPFNPYTTISYSVPIDSHISLNIYDSKGVLIKSFLYEMKKAGEYSVVWDGKNENKEFVASGVYFYQLVSDQFSEIKTMILLR